ncbi:MAG: helix-hairpin-helix domain-containing protein [Prevotella sp.]|nr:helix-hairpin-helix domain-containing protein [Prevotella sp.]
MKQLLLTCLLTLASLTLNAQQTYEWEKYLDALYMAEDEAEQDKEEAFEVLSELATNPISLNTATREDLERIPFLTDEQIEELMAYVYQYHGMRTLGELAMIESLDATRRQLLPFFVYLSTQEERHYPALRTILRKGQHTLMLTGYVPFYQRQGDRNGYLGYPYAHSFRYSFRYGDYLQAGLTGAQDPGEPFFSQGNSLGYDHYSFYILLRKLGRLNTLVAGRYKVSFGQGLVINTALGFGKLAMLSTLGRQGSGIRAHSSRSAANYLQGAAATVQVARNTSLSAFLSYRKIDATLTDSGTIRTILTTGYHRTKTEMARKDNATQATAGGNLNWAHGGFHLGLTAVFTRLSHELTPNTSLYYHRYAPSGNNLWNIGIDYGYTHHRWSVTGETATGTSGGLATLNSLSLQASPALSLLAVQRYYAYKFSSFLGRSFSEGGHVQNESGLLVGMNWIIIRGLTLMAYTDYAYFSHPRYGAHIASHAWDNLLSASYTHGRWSLLARYRLKIRERDNADKTALTNEVTQRGRLSVTWTDGKWSCTAQADLAASSCLQRSMGYMMSGNTTWNPLSWLGLTATIGYFHTDDYASRLYTYERGPLYSFSFPAFYGEGIRYGVFARADFSRHLMAILRLSTTDYFDRDHISSGLQQIDQSAMTDLEAQLRWRF